ncbi:MAG: UDP-N-acetylglucosamine 2-epimerase (non-hydrolyzing) [Pirellulales bacterium]
MTQLQLACIVGARPNFMKMAPLLRALEGESLAGKARATLIHTGQHYDKNLSDVFFEELGMRRPDISLEVGSGSHAVQTARVLERMEEVLQKGPAGGGRFDRLVVVGDVNSTMAASLAAVKLGVSVAHVEAGLRSFDRTMPEEINRIVTDSISDLLLVSDPAGIDNLAHEGHPDEQVHLVGNVMIDTLMRMLPQAGELDSPGSLGLEPGQYGVVTLHRPANVDDPKVLAGLVEVLVDISSKIPLVFPVHPRTAERLARTGLLDQFEQASGIHLREPLGYLNFLSLTSQARVIVTDSGGLQEESTVLGIPCLTMRPNTERPVTVDIGTSTLIGSDPDILRKNLIAVLEGKYKPGKCPELWDGHAAERIAELLVG